MLIDQKILFIFNKFFISFVKDIKDISDDIKLSIKKNYKIIDKSSKEHITEFWDAWNKHIDTLVKSDDNLETLNDIVILKNLKVGDVLSKFTSSEVDTFWNHIYILLIFSYLYNESIEANIITEESDENTEDVEDVEDTEKTEEDEDADALQKLLDSVNDTNNKTEQLDILFNKVVELIAKIQKDSDISEEIDDILDDDIKSLLSKITCKRTKNTPNVDKESSGGGFDMGSIFGEAGKNSKIANLAKEISEEIDISNINIEKPEDIMKMMDFSGSNNVMGDIIKKVSSKISNKIQNGELKQDDLLSEAMGMMSMMGGKGGGLGGLGNLASMFGNNPMMAEMMKNMKKGKPMQTKQDVVAKASTRDRLREKLEKRRQEN
jgi:hypothetical protein